MGRGVGNYSVASCSFGGGRETIRHIERSWRSNWLWVSFWGALSQYTTTTTTQTTTTAQQQPKGKLEEYYRESNVTVTKNCLCANPS